MKKEHCGQCEDKTKTTVNAYCKTVMIRMYNTGNTHFLWMHLGAHAILL